MSDLRDMSDRVERETKARDDVCEDCLHTKDWCRCGEDDWT